MAKLSNILNKNVFTKFVVGDEDSPYTSISLAIEAASQEADSFGKSQVVYIKPGVYNEDLTFKPGVALVGAHIPSTLDTAKLLATGDVDSNFGVFIIGSHEIDCLKYPGEYNLKNIYFLSSGYGQSGSFSSHIISYENDDENAGTSSVIRIENCKFATGYDPTNTSGAIFYCSKDGSVGEYNYSNVSFDNCSFHSPSPASSGEYGDTYNAFHLVGSEGIKYTFNNCEFNATNDAQTQTSMYTCVRLRNTAYSIGGWSDWSTVFNNCKFINFTIVAGEEGDTGFCVSNIYLNNCNIATVTSHFYYCWQVKGPTFKIENSVVNLDEAVFTSENSSGFASEFSSVGTTFTKKDGSQVLPYYIDAGAGGGWGSYTSRSINGLPPMYAVYSHSLSQSAASANHAYPIQFNTHESTVANDMAPPAFGVTVGDDGDGNPTLIAFNTAGIYNLQFSLQLDRISGSGTDSVNIFLRKNSETHTGNVPRSNTVLTVSGNANSAKTVAAWNLIISSDGNDEYQLMWASSSTDIGIIALPAVTGTAPNYYDKVPATPSVILSVTRIG